MHFATFKVRSLQLSAEKAPRSAFRQTIFSIKQKIIKPQVFKHFRLAKQVLAMLISLLLAAQ